MQSRMHGGGVTTLLLCACVSVLWCWRSEEKEKKSDLSSLNQCKIDARGSAALVADNTHNANRSQSPPHDLTT